MSELDDPIGALVESIGTMTRKDVLTIVDAVERFSQERNQSLLGARQLAFQHYPAWLDRLNDVENAAVRRYKEVSASQMDTLELTVFRVALQGATIATMVKPRLALADYRRLVKPASKVMLWLADESGTASTPPATEVNPIQDEDRDADQPSSEESTQMAVATKSSKQTAQKKITNAANNGDAGIATSEVRSKPMAKAAVETKAKQPKAKAGAADNRADAAATRTAEKRVPTGSSDHPTTKHLAMAKKVGVRVANNPHGGYHVTVVGTLYRALSGVFDSAASAKKMAEGAGLEVKAMPVSKASKK